MALLVSGLISASYAYIQVIQYILGLDTSFFLSSVLQDKEHIGYMGTTGVILEKGFVRLNGFNYDPNIFASVLLISMVSSFIFFLNRPRSKRNYLILLLVIIYMVVPFILSFSRGAFLALAITLFGSMLFYVYKGYKFKLINIIYVVMVFCSSILVLIPFSSSIIQRFIGAAAEQSNKYHYIFSKSAFLLFLKRPLLGYGVNTFENVFLCSKLNPFPELKNAFAHSFPINVLFESGVVGLLLYGIVIVGLMVDMLRLIGNKQTPYSKQISLILYFSVLIGLGVHNVVNDYMHLEYMMAFIGFMYAFTGLSYKSTKSSLVNNESPPHQ
jgi:O-antigen ligase